VIEDDTSYGHGDCDTECSVIGMNDCSDYDDQDYTLTPEKSTFNNLVS